jgi:hypothetical protein
MFIKTLLMHVDLSLFLFMRLMERLIQAGLFTCVLGLLETSVYEQAY